VAEEKGATPPQGGRWDHETMRRAAETPVEVEGAAATDTVAASGGLELPGRLKEPPSADQQADRAEADAVPPPTVASVEKVNRASHSEDR
jgi:hypothetical protein